MNVEIVAPDPNEKSRTGETGLLQATPKHIVVSRAVSTAGASKSRRKSLSGGHYR